MTFTPPDGLPPPLHHFDWLHHILDPRSLRAGQVHYWRGNVRDRAGRRPGKAVAKAAEVSNHEEEIDSVGSTRLGCGGGRTKLPDDIQGHGRLRPSR